MILLDIANKINRDRIHGIMRYENLHGPWQFHIIEDPHYEQIRQNLEALDIDGILTGFARKEFWEQIQKMHVPLVFFDYPGLYYDHCFSRSRYSIVTCDNHAVGKMGADYLLGRGFEHFAYVGVTSDSLWSVERRDGFVERLKRADKTCHVYAETSQGTPNDWNVEQPLLAEWLRTLPKPIGLMTARDTLGFQVVNTCELANLRVPEDVSVLGVDDDELRCLTTRPPLSSILRDTEGSGFYAAQMLAKLMSTRGKCKQMEMSYGPLRVVERQSTERFAFTDPRAIQAVRFIRDNHGVGMSVADVAGHLRMSQRGAERFFRKVVGHPICEELQQARLQRVQRLLRETNLSIGSITTQCEFASDSYLGKVFRKHFGLSMRAFRKQGRI